MAVIGNAPFQGLVSGGNIIDASIEGVDLSTSAIAARLGYTPVDPGAAAIIGGTINGTTIGATTAAAGAFTTVSASGAVTLSGGTANGVPYLNGSKVLTTGSALTYNAETFANDTGSTAGTAGFRATNSVANGYTALTLRNTGASGKTYEVGVGGNGTAGNYQNNLYIRDTSGNPTFYLNSTGVGVVGNLSVTGTTTFDGDITTTLGKFYVVNTYGYYFGSSGNLTGFTGSNGTGVISVSTYGTTRATFDTNGVAVTGYLSASGTILANNVSGTTQFRSGIGTDLTLSTGEGLEVLTTATTSTRVMSYSRTAGAFRTLDLSGSSVRMSPNNSTVGEFSTSGLVVTGTGSFTGDITLSGANPSITSSASNAVFSIAQSSGVSGRLELQGAESVRFITYGSAWTERGRFSADGTFRVKGAGTAGSTDAVKFAGTAPASSITLDSTGRLMIGTTSPAMGSAKFTVTGNSVVFNPNTDGANTHIFTTGAVDDGTYAISNASSVTKVYLKANGTSYFNGGEVLVGVTANYTGAKLYVENAINVNYSGEIAMRYNVSGQSTSYWKGMTGTMPGAGGSARGLHFFNYDNDSDEGINFWTGRPGSATQLMKLTPAGRLAIGTTNPAGVLDVGANTLASQFYFRNNSDYNSGGGGQTVVNVVFGGVNIARIANTGTGQRDGVFTLLDENVVKVSIPANSARGGPTYFDAGGNFGIGQTDPQEKLDVNGNVYIHTASGNPYLRIKTDGAGNNPSIRLQAATNYWDIQSTFSSTNDELMFIYNSANKMHLSPATGEGLSISNGGSQLGRLSIDTDGHVQVVRGSSLNGGDYNFRFLKLFKLTSGSGGNSTEVKGTLSLSRVNEIGVSLAAEFYATQGYDSQIRVWHKRISGPEGSYNFRFVTLVDAGSTYLCLEFISAPGWSNWQFQGSVIDHSGARGNFAVSAAENLTVKEVGPWTSVSDPSIPIQQDTTYGPKLFGTNNYDYGIGINTTVANTHVFGVPQTSGNYEEAMRISSAKYVGIGVTNPTHPLHVTKGLRIQAENSDLYNTDGALSYYSSTNGVYLNGPGTNGWLRLNASGGENDHNAINIFGSANARIEFRTANSERMRIDPAGNIGINIISPSTFGKVAIQVTGTTNPTTASNVGPASINLYNGGNGGATNSTMGIFGWHAGDPGIGSGIGFSRESDQNWGSQIRFYTHPTDTSNITVITERARINADGHFLLGTLNPNPFTDTSGTGGLAMRPNRLFVSSDSDCGSFTRIASDGIVWYWARSGSGNVGNVYVSTSGTSYNTTSDYRLKNVTGALTGYKERLMGLQPKQGTWIADGSEFRGFLAHDFANQYPKSVTGEKDAVDVNNKPIMQSMQASTSEVMADLIAMVQDLITENESLKARLNAAGI